MGMITPPCCAIFSLAGVVFLGIMGLVLDSSPIYVKGVPDPEASRDTCYKGAGLYGATFLISVALLIKEKVKRKDSLDDDYAGFGDDGKAGLISNRTGAYGYGSQY
mmetsp:Transcript_23929/g.47631  ORF Transcript_23929/g.47631 Transcript_23929/m.47631 type:complete len:106 (-) Transcript_23929:43-360(-)